MNAKFASLPGEVRLYREFNWPNTPLVGHPVVGSPWLVPPSKSIRI
jgi:hypothetical protein